MFRAAAVAAALGTALVSLAYLINNIVPIAMNLGLVTLPEAAMVAFTTLAPSAAWTVFFVACAKARAPRPPPAVAWITLVFAVLIPLAYQGFQQLSYFSVLALDSLTYLIGGLLLPLAWAVLLVPAARSRGTRGIATILLILTVLAGAMEVAGSATALVGALQGPLGELWNYNAGQAFWRLLAMPAIRIVYWGSQIFFLLVLRRA